MRSIKPLEFSPKSLMAPHSWAGHLNFAYWLTKELKPDVVVELGTHTGNSYFAFCQSIKENGLNSKCYAVDTWQGDVHAGEYANEVFDYVNGHNSENYAGFSTLMRMTFDEASKYFSDKSIQLLHIDGLHTYDAVRNDFETWLPKLKEDAVVLFHDTMVRERDFGVWKLWEELSSKYKDNFEFHHSHGLGVLRLGVGKNSILDELFDNKESHHSIRSIFSGLSKIPVLEAAVREKEKHIKSLELLLSENKKNIEVFQSEENSLRHKLAKENSENDQLRQVVQGKHAEVANLGHLLAAMQSSRSWRYTAPLRSAGSLARPLVRVLRRVRSAARQNSGYGALARKVIALARMEGWQGIRSRLYGALHGKHVVTPAGQVVDRNDYQTWIKLYDTLDAQAIERIQAEIASFEKCPKISVVMPVYNAPLEFLKQAIESVQTQLYPHWELCIADDASTDVGVRSMLESFAKADPRIKFVFRPQNGHISAASNSALELASGDFVALLDNDDLLPSHALYHVAKTILATPDAALIYADEDKINPAGDRYDPYFKCELNYELLLAQNMICHLGVYRRAFLEKIGGFREGFEGAQDYDLTLRVLEQVQPEQVVHIPKVLYHWRAIPGSTALAADEKNYAAIAARKAIEEHLQRTGRGGTVTAAPEAPALNRVRYALPANLPLVSIIIPTRDRSDVLGVCLESVLKKTSYPHFEIIVVDNGSVEQETKQLLASQPQGKVRVVRDDAPFNYSRLNNLAVKAAKGDVVCLMNNDIEVLTPDWLEEMLSFALQADIGCVGARLWYPGEGGLQHGGVVLGVGGIAGHSHKYLPQHQSGYFGRAVLHQSFSAVTGACLVIRRDIWEQVEGLDESFAIAFNDVDFCLRVRDAGYRNVWTPYAEMIHHESLSRGQEDSPEKVARFNGETQRMQQRWGTGLHKDPAYSPNLTDDHEDFSLRWN
jgi:glycosyltransferase involved in cell wall biosynthesis